VYTPVTKSMILRRSSKLPFWRHGRIRSQTYFKSWQTQWKTLFKILLWTRKVLLVIKLILLLLLLVAI
jgi:hypothetical protein